ncbi:SMP-30/gluconolactonase/LRE family protein [Pedobacter sp. Leaf250]|uniref:SMP-30/gluconolactonase/LRE family protein n=1 Tax=Pedobacter sp. Leaf250 TaxID=2876559 RepID=UPI001E5EEC9A|nr:ATP-binding protein [Pedobacter sp. Leaf250]
MKYILAIIILFTSLSSIAQSTTLTKLWESKAQLPVPESVLFIEGQNKLYVSLIDGAANEKDGKGGIAILNVDGSVKNAKWITGLNAPKGMAIYKGKIYVADLDVVYGIDTATAKIVDTTEVPDAVFLNDIAIDNTGIIYVSDTRKNKIHRIENSKSEVYLEDVVSPNGLKFINNVLHVLSGTRLLRFDNNKVETQIAQNLAASGDGLEPDGKGNFIVTCWEGVIYHVNKDGAKQKLLDVRGQMNTADIGYDQKNKILYVPTFNANSVIAYKLKF